MYVADLGRAGYLPLQDFTPNQDFKVRAVMFATRVQGRDEGHYLTGRNGVPASEDADNDLAEGDILCATLWEPGRGDTLETSRPMPGWAFAWPAITTEAVESSGTPDPTVTRTRTATTTKAKILPIRNEQWEPDKQFAELQVNLPPGIDSLPDGIPGILLGGTEHTSQQNIFLPTLPGALVAANRGSKPEKGSTVYDLDPSTNKLSTVHKAKLQSMMRVVRPAAGPSLAWQMGPSALDSLDGYGIMYGPEGPPLGSVTPANTTPPKQDNLDPTKTRTRDPGGTQTTPGGSTPGLGGTRVNPPNTGVIAYASVAKGGPFDLGSRGDQHNHGVSADGEPINAAHLSTQALFRGNGGDAPLLFEGVAYSNPPAQPVRVPAHIRYDAAAGHTWGAGRAGQGMWKLEAEAIGYVPPPFEEPQPPPGGGGGGEGDENKPEPPPPSGSCDRPPIRSYGAGSPWGWVGVAVRGNQQHLATGTQSTLTGTSATGPKTHTDGHPGPGGNRGSAPKEHPAGYPGPAVGSVGDDVKDLKDNLRELYHAGRANEIDAGAVLAAWADSTTRNTNAGLPGPPVGIQQKYLADPRHALGVLPKDTTARAEAHATIPMMVAMPGLLLRPQMVSSGAEDLRHNPKPSKAGLRALERSPMTGRLEVFAAQEAGEFNTTAPAGRGRNPGGTAPGGLILLPPEVDIADAESNFQPSGVVRTETRFIAAYGAEIGYGGLNRKTGQVKNGFSSKVNDTGSEFRMTHRDSSSIAGADMALTDEGRFSTRDPSGMYTLDANNGVLITKKFTGTGDPDTPPPGHAGWFTDTNGVPKHIADDGTVTDLSGGSGGGTGLVGYPTGDWWSGGVDRNPVYWGPFGEVTFGGKFYPIGTGQHDGLDVLNGRVVPFVAFKFASEVSLTAIWEVAFSLPTSFTGWGPLGITLYAKIGDRDSSLYTATDVVDLVVRTFRPSDGETPIQVSRSWGNADGLDTDYVPITLPPVALGPHFQAGDWVRVQLRAQPSVGAVNNTTYPHIYFSRLVADFH